MAESTGKKQRLELVFAALMSDDDATVNTALTRVEAHGDAKAILPLLSALAKTKSVTIQQRITSMLFQVKAPDAVGSLIEALHNPELRSVRRTVLATFWNAGLDVREHLDVFVSIALEADPEECFECSTVIENQEMWPEKAARSALVQVRKAATTEIDPYKRAMLSDLTGILEGRLGVE